MSVCTPLDNTPDACGAPPELAAGAWTGFAAGVTADRPPPPPGVAAWTIPITERPISLGSQTAEPGPPGTRSRGTRNIGTLTRTASSAQWRALRVCRRVILGFFDGISGSIHQFGKAAAGP
jgi:hypothetical protein